MNANRAIPAMQQLRDGGDIILPSLLQCDFGNLEREIHQLEEAGTRGLHLDVMDGHFVPNLSYGMPIVEAVRKMTALPLDVHLMISEPSKYLRQFADAGADCITVHAEIEEDTAEVLQQTKQLGLGVGLAINPGTGLESVLDLLPLCDLLLPMSVNAGFGGQKFNAVALEKLTEAKRRHPDLLLEVDGGVNAETISSCKQAGATLFVVGSAIFGQEDYRKAFAALTTAIGR